MPPRSPWPGRADRSGRSGGHEPTGRPRCRNTGGPGPVRRELGRALPRGRHGQRLRHVGQSSSGISRVLYAAIPMRWPIVLSKAVVQAAQAALLSLATVAAALVGMRLSRSSALGDTRTPLRRPRRRSGWPLRRRRWPCSAWRSELCCAEARARCSASCSSWWWLPSSSPPTGLRPPARLGRGPAPDVGGQPPVGPGVVTAPTSGRATWVAWSALAMWSCVRPAVAVRILNRADL